MRCLNAYVGIGFDGRVRRAGGGITSKEEMNRSTVQANGATKSGLPNAPERFAAGEQEAALRVDDGHPDWPGKAHTAVTSASPACLILVRDRGFTLYQATSAECAMSIRSSARPRNSLLHTTSPGQARAILDPRHFAEESSSCQPNITTAIRCIRTYVIRAASQSPMAV